MDSYWHDWSNNLLLQHLFFSSAVENTDFGRFLYLHGSPCYLGKSLIPSLDRSYYVHLGFFIANKGVNSKHSRDLWNPHLAQGLATSHSLSLPSCFPLHWHPTKRAPFDEQQGVIERTDGCREGHDQKGQGYQEESHLHNGHSVFWITSNYFPPVCWSFWIGFWV